MIQLEIYAFQYQSWQQFRLKQIQERDIHLSSRNIGQSEMKALEGAITNQCIKMQQWLLILTHSFSQKYSIKWTSLINPPYIRQLKLNSFYKFLQNNLLRTMKEGFFQDQTQQYVDDIKNGNSTVLVVVRVRPLTAREAAVNSNEITQVLQGKVIALLDKSEETQKRNKSRETQFSFDFVYEKKVSTREIYDDSISNLLDGVLDGYNSTVITYGATGSGKTYTMIGQSGKQGITALAVIDLLSRTSELRKQKNVLIKLAYIEIYNQFIKDLLISQDKILQLREDPKEGIIIPGVTEIVITSLLQLHTILKVGAANRSKEATDANQLSSRSHSILMLKTETRDRAQGIKEEVSIGRLSLVDLAGSERSTWKKSTRQLQGAKINRSLLALSNCITVLSQNNNKNIFVPYRQSKLTRLLKESLGGNCRTAMIANITPFFANWEETHNTLVYAARARNIKNNPRRNVQASEAHLGNYVALINNLKRENDQLKKQLRGGKENSLPQLRGGAVIYAQQQSEIQKLQNNIVRHFERQRKILQEINQLSLKIDKAGFNLYRLYLEKSRKQRKSHNENRGEKQIRKIKQIIEDLNRQKEGLEESLEELSLQRSRIVGEIQSSALGGSNISSLMSHYREIKVELQLYDIKLREGRLESEKIEKQQLVKWLKEELITRDRIIEGQKIILQKNNIINRITYSKLTNSVVPTIIENLLEKPNVSISTEANLEDLSSPKKDSQKINRPMSIKYSKATIIKNKLVSEGKDLSISNNSPKKLKDTENEQEGLFPQFVSLKTKRQLESKRRYPKLDFASQNQR